MEDLSGFVPMAAISSHSPSDPVLPTAKQERPPPVFHPVAPSAGMQRSKASPRPSHMRVESISDVSNNFVAPSAVSHTPSYPPPAWETSFCSVRRDADELSGVSPMRSLPRFICDTEAEALRFAFTRQLESRVSAERTDLWVDCFNGATVIRDDERSSRFRLYVLTQEVEEQMGRCGVADEYDKFVVFCLHYEPVWRRAARQLQLQHEERLNSTECCFQRFTFQEEVCEAKTKMFQQASDYVTSLKFAERDEREVALRHARDRRRSQVLYSDDPLAGGSVGAHRRRHSPAHDTGSRNARRDVRPAFSAEEAAPPRNARGGGRDRDRGTAGDYFDRSRGGRGGRVWSQVERL